MMKQSEKVTMNRMRAWVSRACMAVIMIAAATAELPAQVSFSPSVLILDADNPVQEIIITNLSNAPREVIVSKQFGYPAYTDNGKLNMVYQDSTNKAAYNLDPYLRIYPNKTIIPARTRQTVRVQVLHQQMSHEHTYWTRLGIRSQEVARTVSEADSAARGTLLTYVIQQNMGVFYTKAEARTTLELGELSYTASNDTLNVQLPAKRAQNSPYLGMVNARLLNGAGEVIGETEQITNVYFETVVPITIHANEELSGNYRVEVTFTTTRADIPSNKIFRAEPQVITKDIQIVK